ncbi:MAG: D-alanyl-D-alanine carboxypeptidase, partial [Pseudomonadota bacterium]
MHLVPPSAARRAPFARALALVALACSAAFALAQVQAHAQSLPPEVDAALARAKVPRDAVTMLVADADGLRPPRLAWRTQVPVNPASIMKLVTTYAALDLLGPAFTWRTPVFTDG